MSDDDGERLGVPEARREAEVNVVATRKRLGMRVDLSVAEWAERERLTWEWAQSTDPIRRCEISRRLAVLDYGIVPGRIPGWVSSMAKRVSAPHEAPSRVSRASGG